MTVGTSMNILERRNNVTDIFHKQHNRSYAFTMTMQPNERFALDVGYDYNDILSQTNICFVGSLRPPGTSPCPTAAALLQQVSLYDNQVHFGHADLMWKPVKRVTTRLGYAVTSTTGSTLILLPNAPTGPLQIEYHKPYAALAIELYRGLFWKTSWGYYGYNEKAPPDPFTAARDFRGNIFTLAVRYAF